MEAGSRREACMNETRMHGNVISNVIYWSTERRFPKTDYNRRTMQRDIQWTKKKKKHGIKRTDILVKIRKNGCHQSAFPNIRTWLDGSIDGSPTASPAPGSHPSSFLLSIPVKLFVLRGTCAVYRDSSGTVTAQKALTIVKQRLHGHLISIWELLIAGAVC